MTRDPGLSSYSIAQTAVLYQSGIDNSNRSHVKLAARLINPINFRSELVHVIILFPCCTPNPRWQSHERGLTYASPQQLRQPHLPSCQSVEKLQKLVSLVIILRPEISVIDKFPNKNKKKKERPARGQRDRRDWQTGGRGKRESYGGIPGSGAGGKGTGRHFADTQTTVS